MRTTRPILALLCGLCFAGGSLAAQPIQIQAKEALFGKTAKLSDFAQESLKTFTVFTLPNGIPVIVKRNTANRVQHLSLVLAGGSLLQNAADAGTEALALAVMARGSAAYGYADIQNLLDETSSSIGQAAGFDSSSYSLNTLDTYFDRLLPVWADTLVNPAFSEKDFSQVLSDSRIALQSKEQDPWAKTGQVMNVEFFKDHPYGAPPEGTKESLAVASLAKVRSWYSGSFSANRIFLVAVGNFDVPKLKKSLEATIGTIPDRRVPLPKSIPSIRSVGTGKLLKQDYPQSKGVGYLRGDFPAPGPEDDDYMALNVGMKMLSDLLFNVVRDKYGAVYSPGASIRAFNANYGSLSIFKTKVASEVKAYIDEAVASLAAGYCLSVDPTLSEGTEPRMTIEQALPVYKALFLNSYYEKQQTNAAVAAQIASSVIRSSDFRSYLLDSERVMAVTAEGIRTALRKYLLEGSITWVALGSKDVIDPIDQAGFTVPFAARPELTKTKK